MAKKATSEPRQESLPSGRPVRVADRDRALAIAKKISKRDRELLKRLAR